jgi:large subunit ribosomal protein L30
MAEKKTAENEPATNETAAKPAVKKTAAKKAAPKKVPATKKAARKADKPKLVKAERVKPEKTVKITLMKSVIGTKASHRATVRGLGLRRIRHSVELEDTPSVRGMINKVSYLVRVDA